MDQQWTAGSVFEPAAPQTLDLIRRRVTDRRCTFLTSSNYMNAASAKFAYLLSEQLAAGGGAATSYRSFLINSGPEALSGAIKLARQTSVRRKRTDSGWVLLLDPKGTFAPFLDPTSRGAELALTPHVRVVSNTGQALDAVHAHKWSALVVVRQDGDSLAEAALTELVGEVKAQGGLTVLCNTELALSDPTVLIDPVGADVVVFGENLVEGQAPFGCFAMTERAYEVWNNDVDCFAQTATFGGNAFCAELALEALQRHGLVHDSHRKVFAAIDADPATMRQYWGKYINPTMAKLAPVFGMDLEVTNAYGGRIWLDDGREIIDCSGGFGSNLRGHNTPAVLGVLDEHDPEHDYFADLERFLAGATGYGKAFPAVSGATAVDTAVTIAMLANPDRTKVVTFTGNFAGKTLFALNLSKHGPQLTETDEDAFRPYYAELVYLDPFAEDAVAKLRDVLATGDVALIWFELIRGGMCEALPEPIVNAVNELKDTHGYLIGVDEVLTGGWRTGRGYLAHTGVVPDADVVALGKTMTDMVFPMAAALCTTDTYERAQARDAGQVNLRRSYHRNALGAHIALRALSAMAEDGTFELAAANQRIIEAALRRLVARSKVFESVDGEGALLRLALNSKYFPFHHRSKLGNMLEMATAHLIFERCGVFVFLLRFLHRVATSEEDARELARRLESGLRGIKPWDIYRYAISRMFSMKSEAMAGLIAVGLRKPTW